MPSPLGVITLETTISTSSPFSCNGRLFTLPSISSVQHLKELRKLLEPSELQLNRMAQKIKANHICGFKCWMDIVYCFLWKVSYYFRVSLAVIRLMRSANFSLDSFSRSLSVMMGNEKGVGCVHCLQTISCWAMRSKASRKRPSSNRSEEHTSELQSREN